MSGGHFDYDQYRIDNIANEVEQLIIMNGVEQNTGENWYDYTFVQNYSPEVIEEFKKGLKILRMATIYAQRIDWLVSGDYGEEQFLKRLAADLDELENKK